MAQSTTCASPVLRGTPIDVAVRLEGVKSANSSSIPSSELAKHSPIFSPKLPSTAVSLLSSVSSHLTPLPSVSASGGGIPSSSPSRFPSTEDLETPPLAHVPKAQAGEEATEIESEALPALLARVSRPPPFPFVGVEDGNEDSEDEHDGDEGEGQEREQPEAVQSADGDDDGSRNDVQEALSSLALADEV